MSEFFSDITAGLSLVMLGQAVVVVTCLVAYVYALGIVVGR